MAGCRHAAAVKGEEEEAARSGSFPREIPWDCPNLGTQSGAGTQGASGQVPAPSAPRGTQRRTWVLVLDGAVPRDEDREGCMEPQPPHARAEAVCIVPDLQFITWITVACSLPGSV